MSYLIILLLGCIEGGVKRCLNHEYFLPRVASDKIKYFISPSLYSTGLYSLITSLLLLSVKAFPLDPLASLLHNRGLPPMATSLQFISWRSLLKQWFSNSGPRTTNRHPDQSFMVQFDDCSSYSLFVSFFDLLCLQKVLKLFHFFVI